MNPCFIDHITIASPTLEVGAELVYRSLGVKPQKGGEHPRMGTHNLLLHLGESTFLEVISINSKAKKPTRARWFALDDIKNNTPPKLKTWVVRTQDIQTALAGCTEDLGKIEPMSRGETNWRITIPKDGRLPLQEGAPALIQWEGDSHPAFTLKDYGLSLFKLQIFHPEHDRLNKLLDSLNLQGNIDISSGNKTKIIAHINTPHGIRQLHA